MRHSSNILQEIAETVASTLDGKTFLLGGENNLIPEANQLLKRITEIEIPRLKETLQKEIEEKERRRFKEFPRNWKLLEEKFLRETADPINSRIDQYQALADRLRTLQQDFYRAKSLEAMAEARSKERDFQDRVKNAPNLAAPDPAIADAIFKLRKKLDMPLEAYVQGLLSAAVKAESLMLEAEMQGFPIPEFQIPEIPSSFIEAVSALVGRPIVRPKIGDSNIHNFKIQKRGRERDEKARLEWEKDHPEI